MINLSGFLLWTFIQERNFVHGCRSEEVLESRSLREQSIASVKMNSMVEGQEAGREQQRNIS